MRPHPSKSNLNIPETILGENERASLPESSNPASQGDGRAGTLCGLLCAGGVSCLLPHIELVLQHLSRPRTPRFLLTWAGRPETKALISLRPHRQNSGAPELASSSLGPPGLTPEGASDVAISTVYGSSPGHHILPGTLPSADLSPRPCEKSSPFPDPS